MFAKLSSVLVDFLFLKNVNNRQEDSQANAISNI